MQIVSCTLRAVPGRPAGTAPVSIFKNRMQRTAGARRRPEFFPVSAGFDLNQCHDIAMQEHFAYLRRLLCKANCDRACKA